MGRTALYRYFDADDRLLYVGISCNPLRRGYEHASRAQWSQSVSRMAVCWFETREDALRAEAIAIHVEAPTFNVAPVGGGALGFCNLETGVTLRHWLKENRVTQAAFAAHIGINPGVLSRFISGQAQPSIETAVLIQRATRGEVLPVVWTKDAAHNSQEAA